ncbi:MAG: phage tail protein [Mycobacterium sp.]
MTSPGGKEVGRISIRVVPDTDRFRQALKAKLEQIERALSGEVDVSPDTRGFRQKVAAVTRNLPDAAVKIKADLDRRVLAHVENAFQQIKPNIRVDSGFDSQIRERLNDFRAKVTVEPDLDQFQTAMLARLRAATRNIQPRIPLTASGERFRRSVTAQVASVERTIKAKIPVTMELAAGQRTKIAAQVAALERLAGERRGGTLRSIHDGFVRIGESAARALARVRVFGVGMLGLAAIASLLAPALALLSSVLVGLPALLTAIAVPIGVIALGMDGMKKAASVLAPDFQKLKTTISGAFEDRFTPIFERMRAVFPLLNQELPKVVDGLAELANGAIDAVTSHEGMHAIRNTIANIGQSLRDAAPGMHDFTRGLLKLISGVSNHLPGLAGTFNDFAERFAEWVDKITSVDDTGVTPLERMMSGLRESVQGVLDLFASLATDGFDLMANGNMGQAIRDFLDGFKKLAHETLPSLARSFETMSAAIKGIADTWNGIEWAIAPDKKLFESLTGQELPAITEQLKQIWQRIKQGALGAFNGISAGFASSLVGIGAAASNVGATLQQAWSGLGGIATAAWESVASTVDRVINQAVQAVTVGGTQAVAEIASWPGRFIGALGDLGSLLVDSGRALVQGLIDGIRSKVSEAVGAMGSLMQSLRDLVPFSPAKVGPFSGKGWVLYSGQAIGEALAEGIASRESEVVRAARKMMNSANDEIDASKLDMELKIANMSKFAGMPADFFQANQKQLFADLGIGGGAITQGGQAAFDFAKQAGQSIFNFHVSNADEAIAVKNNQINKQALQFNGR